MSTRKSDDLSERETAVINPTLVQRYADETLSEHVRQARDNPLFAALLKWIDGAVVVLNGARQIVMASQEFAELARAGSVEDLLGKRIGETLRCVNSKKGPDGCGTSAACNYCGSFKSILATETNKIVESECRLFLEGDGEPQSIKMLVKATRTRDDDHDFTVLAFKRADPAGISFTDQKTLVQMASTSLPRLGEYTTVRRLGAGGMGAVYFVRDHEGHEYALKTLRQELSFVPHVIERFLREGAIASALDHPNIVKTLGVQKLEDGTAFIVFEYCPGGSVSQWLQNNGPVPVDRALGWMHGAASAISYMWTEHDTVHRDIKPDNLLIGADGEIKIADFGIARQHREEETKLTMTGNVLGTVRYIAPEQIAGNHEIDTRADLYALGATFYELLSGATPFGERDTESLIAAKLFEEPPRLEERMEGLPEGLYLVIDRLLARYPEQRFRDPDELIGALRPLAGALRIDFA